MRARLVPLGTSGYLPAAGRQTMSFLLLGESTALLLDAGTGVARLLEPTLAALLAPYPRLEVLLTHYHLDHVVGLSYLPGVWRGRPARIFAPRPPLTEGDPASALGRLIAPPLFPQTLAGLPLPVEVVPYDAGELRVGDLTLTVRAQRHPGGSAGVRVGDLVAYCTDTEADPATAELARGVPLLLHEVWLTDEEARRDEAARAGHSAAGEVADLARAAGVGRLWPVHHHPRRDRADLAALARGLAARAGLPVEVATEGEVYELDA
jgi:ribonuclease BN (tRNA processing enzyme)